MFSRLDLRGARVLLTGASSGIGAALALRLGSERARLALASRNQERLEKLAADIRNRGGEAVALPTDVADPAQRTRLIEATASAWGGLDMLINNAGVGAMGWFADATEERLRRIFEVNFFAATELTRLALPHLRSGRNPMLVNVSSVVGRRGLPGCTEYCASKFALTGWSESLRPELARLGIHVLIATPGRIATEFRSNLLEDRFRFGWQHRRAMSADRCAQLLVGAIRRRRNEIVITSEAKLVLWLNRLLPWLVDRALGWYTRQAKPASASADTRWQATDRT
jgi:short-subunit dehydrogenase